MWLCLANCNFRINFYIVMRFPEHVNGSILRKKDKACSDYY